MDAENDVQLSVPRTSLNSPPESLTLPPIELEEHATKKKSTKRRRLRRRRPKKGDPSNLFSQKSQSSRSSNDQLRLSLDSPISHFVNADRMTAVKPLFRSFIMMNASGYAALVLFMWYHQHCTVGEGALTGIDNMAAYTIYIVSIACVVFSTEVQTTSPYNIIYPCAITCSMAYLVAKIVCNRELILILEMCVIVGIEGLTIYTAAVYSSKDFTPLTPVLIAAYTCTTVLNVGVIYFIRESVPIIMLSIISLFTAYGLCLCIMQFSITKDPRYRLPANKQLLGALMLEFAFVSLSFHTYLAIVALFDVYGVKKFQYYMVNLTFYLEQ